MLRQIRLIYLLCLLTLTCFSHGRAAESPVHFFDCKECHLSGLTITELGGNNVCLKCHDMLAGDVALSAGAPPALDGHTDGRFSVGDASNAFGHGSGQPGAYQTSHTWAAPSDTQPAAGALPPLRSLHPEFFSRYGTSVGRLTCSRCHNPHASVESNPKLLVKGNASADTMCRACHRPWVLNNRGWLTHPIVDDYNASVAANPGKYRATLSNQWNADIRLVAGGVSCTSCHGAHFVDSSATTADGPGQALNPADGKLLRGDGPGQADKSSLCQTCHTYSAHRGSVETAGCLVCHSGHSYDPDYPNYYVLRKSATTATFGTVSGLDYSSPSVLVAGLKYTFWNDGADGTANGYCEKCHGDAINIGSGAGSYHVASAICTDCHSHSSGSFGHGDGSGGGSCEACHGHDPGYEYAAGEFSQGKGSVSSHSTHTENDADDLRGPNISCSDCHDIAAFPYFKSGTDSNGDGRYSLAETDVCDACHSPGGSYDGVNDATIGAKTNWDAAVYAGSGLQAGKERWCATCHDDAPSVISSTNAPNVVGDETGSYTYGAGWGYYKTGHGLVAEETYPSKGGVETLSGRPVECDSCHDYTSAHIDGNSRTFNDNDSSGTDPSVYRLAYRLKQVAAGTGTGASGQEPLLVPWPLNTANTADASRLCFDCHDPAPYLDAGDMNTNLVTDGVNRHEYHLNQNNLRYSSDWDFIANNSRMTCVVCHNVHGSTHLAMVRDGKLINREPGLIIWYNNDAIVANNSSNPNPPVPENLPLSASTGTIWRGGTSANLCSHCHGDNNTTPEYRTPFQNVQQAPTLSFTGEIGYESDGASPDAAVAGSSFEFRVTYTDLNNEAPSVIQVWVDIDDNGTYEPGEKFAMTGAVTLDSNYVNGKHYTRSLILTKAGDNTLKYRFYASDGLDDATGPPVNDGSVRVLNNTPRLSWTGEAYYASDGVNPDPGGHGGSFTFRVNYTDGDNECPPAASNILVWIDENDNGTYEPGEKFNMTAVDGGDVTCSDGKLFTFTRTLTYAGDGLINYTFRSSDGFDPAVAEAGPLENSALTIHATANNPPVLDWVSGSCFTNSVKPATGLATGNFEFRVTYTDPDNQAPDTIQVWIDINDDGDYLDAGEKQNMAPAGGGDGNYANGEDYTYSTALAYAGDGALKFRFAAADALDSAVGHPTTSDSTVNVISTANAKGVRAGGGGDPWYADIQSAIGTNDNITVVVYEGTYGTVNLTSRSNVTVQSVCGADFTTITGAGNLVFFQNCGDNTVDGFTLSGGSTGVATNSATGTSRVRNSKINSPSAGVSFGATSGSIIVENSEIYGSTTGVNITSQSGHQFINTTIRNNTTGIFLQNTSATFTGCLIKENSNSGLRCNNATPVFRQSQLIANSAPVGGAVYSGNASFNLTLENTVVAGNHATSDDTYGRGGGAFYVTGGTVNIKSSTLADNVSEVSRGGLGFFQNTTLTMDDSILWGNTAAIEGHIIHTNSAGSINLTDMVIANDGDAIFTNAPYFTGSITPAMTGYISEGNPRFVDAAASDYHLRPPSVAIDTGSTDLTIDIDNQSRPQGAADDIGADEVLLSSGLPRLTWTGETGYAADGADPDSGAGGASYTFRIDYTSPGKVPPAVIELWLDADDNGAYDAGEKHALTETDSGDTDYTDGKRFSVNRTISPAGDGVLKYQFYASDGTYEATGAPTTGATIQVSNNIPVLGWTGEANYTADGVDPGSATGGSSFTFRIDYTDADNTAPAVIQLWVDVNDNGSYEPAEKLAMTAVDGGDTTYSDGKRYSLSRPLSYAGDGSLSYRFHASDGSDSATGLPTTGDSLTVVNNVPLLTWTGEINYTTDGVNPDSGNAGDIYTFRVDYTDADNTAPTALQVWIDENDNDIYDDEKFSLSATDVGDTDYTDGKRYSLGKVLGYNGDGVYKVRFYASDGAADATGAPTADGTVAVADMVNSPPTLSWTTADCLDNGARPPIGATATSFEFLVSYTDADNHCADTIQVWIDADDNALYDAGEKHDLTEVDAGDTDCTDGKLYRTTRTLATAGDGLISYRFQASDGIAPASGPPTADASVGVYAGVVVRPGSSVLPKGYTSVITAANAVSGNIVVYPNDDFSAATYAENITLYNKDNRNLLSACGADRTILSSPVTTTAVITAQDSANLVVDGFSMTGATSSYGVNVNRVDATPLVIRNSKIYGNAYGIYINDSDDVPVQIDTVEIRNNSVAGIYMVNGDDDASIVNSEIHSHNVTGNGAAICMNNGNTVTITNSVLRNNTTTASGGAIYLNAAGGNLTLINSQIYGNQAGTGGAISMATGSFATIRQSVIRDNVSTGQGGAIYTNAANFNVENSIFARNRGTNGGVINTNSGPTVNIVNSTFADNTATGSGGVFYMCATGSTTVRNSIFWNNTASGSGDVAYKACSGFLTEFMTITDSDVSTSGNSFGNGTPSASNNMDPAQDPLFVNPAADNYHLQAGSPVIDQANAAYAPAVDIDGQSRPQGVADDMGADEFFP